MAATARAAIAAAGTFLVGTAGASAQATPVLDGSTVVGITATAVSEAWEIPIHSVRVEVAGDVPAEVDSVLVEEGGRDRWIMTMWVGDGRIRRFVKAGSMAPFAVAVRAMARGVMVDSTDVRIEARVAWGAPDPDRFFDPVGMTTERVIGAGEALMPPAVRPPLLVRGGDPVEAVLERSGVIMRVQAEALGSARDGDLLLVRLASGLRMEARVVAPGIVALIGGGG